MDDGVDKTPQTKTFLYCVCVCVCVCVTIYILYKLSDLHSVGEASRFSGPEPVSL